MERFLFLAICFSKQFADTQKLDVLCKDCKEVATSLSDVLYFGLFFADNY